MALRVTLRRKGGKTALAGKVQIPVNSEDVVAALHQLQESVNELITRFNAHTHTGVTVGAGTSGAPSAGTLVSGTVVTDTGLFTTAETT